MPTFLVRSGTDALAGPLTVGGSFTSVTVTVTDRVSSSPARSRPITFTLWVSRASWFGVLLKCSSRFRACGGDNCFSSKEPP